MQNAIKASNLYMIGQRKEAFFSFPENIKCYIDQEKIIKGEFNSGAISSAFSINVEEIITEVEKSGRTIDKVDIELGKKFIRITGDDGEIVDWFTTEKLLFDRSRQRLGISGLDDYRELMTYYLHYVGISKKEDSLMRLVIRPHDNRLRILSNESPLNSGSRVTDEIILFFFEIDTLQINIVSEKLDIDTFVREMGIITGTKIEIISDAEKAFIKVMQTNYNKVDYDSYPDSTDGLAKYSLDRYGFSINESITFVTDSIEIVGEFSEFESFSTRWADAILVDADEVELKKFSKSKTGG